jgi:hypothetical protein
MSEHNQSLPTDLVGWIEYFSHILLVLLNAMVEERAISVDLVI